jgi:hypothetical protein
MDFMMKALDDWIVYIKDELRDKSFKEMFEVIDKFNTLREKGIVGNIDEYPDNKTIKKLIDDNIVYTQPTDSI